MSLQQGSFSLTRYRVVGRRKRLSIAELNQNLFSYQAAPITLKRAAREMTYGWVLPDNPELEDAAGDRQDSWDLSDCLFEDGILLRIRLDKKSVSSQLQQALVRQRWLDIEKHEKTDAGAGKESSRVQRKQILDQVKEELLELSLPTISFVEAYWKDQEDVVYLFSQSKMARDAFEELFRKTFGETHNLSLFRILPPLMGLTPEAWESLSEGSKLLEKLRHTLPSGSGDLSVS